MWTLYLPDLALGVAVLGALLAAAAVAGLATFGLLPVATDVLLLQLDVSGSLAVVEAVVTVPGEADDEEPLNRFEKKPVIEGAPDVVPPDEPTCGSVGTADSTGACADALVAATAGPALAGMGAGT